MRINLRLIKIIYVGSFAVLGIFVVLTPSLITGKFSIFREEVAEGAVLLILLILGFIINFFYQRELRERQSVLRESLQYIGV